MTRTRQTDKTFVVNCGCKLSGRRVVGLPAHLNPRFLVGLSKNELNAVLSLAVHRQFLASSVITHQEDPAERMFLLTRGSGRHFVLTRRGRKILLHWLTPGQVFGAIAIISAPSPYLASTELLTDSCVLVWDREAIRTLASKFPKLIENVLSIAATEHVAWLLAAHVSLAADDAEGRIATMLVSLACGIGRVSTDGVEIPIANEDLAAGANVTPFTVSRSLARWQREGLLTKGRGKILLRRPDLLVTS